MAVPPPLAGFNDNVRYRGRRYHIQTEDSGVARPHIVTHLFADGGHIIKTIRRGYAEHIDSTNRSTTVGNMMAEQHAAMAIALRRGRLDSLLAPPPPPSALDDAALDEEQAPAQPVSDPPRAYGDRVDGLNAPPSHTWTSIRPFPPSESEGSGVTVAVAEPRPRLPDTAEPQPELTPEPPSQASPRSTQPATLASPDPGSDPNPASERQATSRPSLRIRGQQLGQTLFGAAPEPSLGDAIRNYLTNHSRRTTGKKDE